MGCAASRGVNPIDAALIQALIEAKKRRGPHGLTFNELLLKFPKAGASRLGAETGAGRPQRRAAATDRVVCCYPGAWQPRRAAAPP